MGSSLSNATVTIESDNYSDDDFDFMNVTGQDEEERLLQKTILKNLMINGDRVSRRMNSLEIQPDL